MKDITPTMQALAKIVISNGGSIPPHERDRALELAKRIDEHYEILEVERCR